MNELFTVSELEADCLGNPGIRTGCYFRLGRRRALRLEVADLRVLFALVVLVRARLRGAGTVLRRLRVFCFRDPTFLRVVFTAFRTLALSLRVGTVVRVFTSTGFSMLGAATISSVHP